ISRMKIQENAAPPAVPPPLPLDAANTWNAACMDPPVATSEHTGPGAAGYPTSGEGEGVRSGRAEVPVGELGGHPSPRGPLQEPELQQVRLVHLLHRLGLLPHPRRPRGQPHRAPLEIVYQRGEDGD